MRSHVYHFEHCSTPTTQTSEYTSWRHWNTHSHGFGVSNAVRDAMQALMAQLGPQGQEHSKGVTIKHHPLDYNAVTTFQELGTASFGMFNWNSRQSLRSLDKVHDKSENIHKHLPAYASKHRLFTPVTTTILVPSSNTLMALLHLQASY
jgi:hypothetical protein